MVGLAGIIIISSLSVFYGICGSHMEIDSVAAVVIGGTALYGGQGGVIGSLFGAGVLSVLKNVLNLHNVQDFAQRVFTGILIIGVVVIDQLRRRFTR